jgi:lipid intermediate transporter
MPICISCSAPLPHLYTTYSKADSPTLGKGVRLTQCPHCKRFADKYVEHDFVVLFIDLVLIKPQVYRHLLFNRLGNADASATSATVGRTHKSLISFGGIDSSILRLGTLLVLFDVYITWARIEKATTPSTSTTPSSGALSAQWALSSSPILTQYLFFLTMNVIATITQHFVIRTLARYLVPLKTSPAASNAQTQAQSSTSFAVHSQPPVIGPRPGTASPASISTALLVSSCTKLFPILLVIWPTSLNPSATASVSSRNFSSHIASFTASASSYVGYAVLLNNIEALLILLDCGYLIATTLAVSGIGSRWVIESWALTMVGLRNPKWEGLRGWT